MKKIVKLKFPSNFPTKLVNNAYKGIPDSLGSQDLNFIGLDRKIGIHHKLNNNVIEIDDFNKSKKLMPNKKQVRVTYRNEDYVRNIGKFTEPLLLSKDWDNKTISIVNNVWEKLYKDGIIVWDHQIFDCCDEWMYTGKYEECHKKYDLDLDNYLKQWRDHSQFNFHPLFDTIKTMKTFNVTDFSATGLILANKRNGLVDNVNYNIETIKRDVERIKFHKTLKTKKAKGIPLDRIFLAFDFESIFPYEPSSAWWLDCLHKAIMEIEGGEEFIKNFNGDIYGYFDSPIGKKISSHPLVEECGHSGMTFLWTIYILNRIYNLGWEAWLKEL